MADRKHASNVGMSSSSTHLKPSSSSTPLSAKVSTASSQMFQPHPMLSTTMMPSIEAYLEAYQSLLGGGTFGRDPASALSALAGNYSLRPTGGLPMSMPFIPPSYFTFPSYPMDMSPYGLMSPVLLPPFFASLYCDPSSSGAATTATAVSAAATLGRGSVATDYRDASMKLNSSLQWPAVEKDEIKSRSVESKEVSAVKSSSASHTKKDAAPPAASHSAVRSTPTKDALSRSQTLQQHHITHNSTMKSLLSPAGPLPHGTTGGDHGLSRANRSTLPVGSSDKARSRPSEVAHTHAASLPDQDGVPIDFSAATSNRFSSSAVAAVTRDAVQHPKSNKSSTEASGAVPSRASVVVAPAADRDRHTARVAPSTVANQPSFPHSSSSDVKTSSAHRSSSGKDFETQSDSSSHGVKIANSGSSEIKKSPENGRVQKDILQYGTLSLDVSTKTLTSQPIPLTNQQPLRLDANTLSLLKNVKADAQPLVRHESTASVGVTSLATPSAHLPCPPSGGLQHQRSPIEADRASSINGIARRRISKSDRKRQPESAPSASTPCATDLSVSSTAAVSSSTSIAGNSATAASAAAGVEEFRCSLCNYSGRSQHCLTKHMRAHDVAYKICQYCRRAFERPSDLLRHEERHRRRDVSGSSPLAGGALAPLPQHQQQQAQTQQTTGTCSTSVSCLSVGRVDSYSGGTMEWTNLIAVGVGSGDNEIVLDFENLSAASQANSRPPPEPSKLRDVYSIMAGIVVAQSLASISPGKPQPTIPFLDVTPLQVAVATVTDADGGVAPPSMSFDPSTNPNAADEVESNKTALTYPDAVAVQTGNSTKVEFLRKLELEIAEGDEIGSSRSLIDDQPLGTVLGDGAGSCRRNRRKGRPVRATLSGEFSEEMANQRLASCRDVSISESNDASVMVDSMDTKPMKRCCTHEDDCEDGVEVKRRLAQIGDNAATVKGSPPAVETSHPDDGVVNGKVRRLSAGPDTRLRNRRSVIGKLVLRSRLFQRRQVKKGTAHQRHDEKTDSNGNALPPKSTFRGQRHFTSSAEMTRRRLAKGPSGCTRRAAIEDEPVAETEDEMVDQSVSIVSGPGGL